MTTIRFPRTGGDRPKKGTGHKFLFNPATGKTSEIPMHGGNKELGTGFQEVIYQRALYIEMNLGGISSKREFEMPIYYRGEDIGVRRVDFLVEGVISVEIKAISKLEAVQFAQAINYLEAYNLEIGLLINFGETSLTFNRLTNKKFKII